MLNDFYLDRCLKVETELTQHLLRVRRGAREPAGATSATALLGQEVSPGRPAQRTGCRCSPLNSPPPLPCTLAHFLRGLRGAPAFKGSLRSPSTCLHLNFSLATLAFSNIITDYEWVKFRIY